MLKRKVTAGGVDVLDRITPADVQLDSGDNYDLSSYYHKLQTLVLTGTEVEQERAIATINTLSNLRGIIEASIQDVYAARSRGETPNVTIPAINTRIYTSSIVYSALTAAKAIGAQHPVIFEIAKSEAGYTGQSYPRFVALAKLGYLMAGAENTNVYLQADHCQVGKDAFWKQLDDDQSAGITDTKELLNKNKAVQDSVKLIRSALEAGILNIDIDASVLERLEGTPEQKQEWNGKVTAYLVAKIREMEAELKLPTVSIGGEVGEIGAQNTTRADVEAYLKWTVDELKTYGKGDYIGFSKISLMTGTSHGGVKNPDGTVNRNPSLDWDIHAITMGIANPWFDGAIGLVTVQHGASTLAPELFKAFAAVGAIGVGEVHLATEYQNVTLAILKEYAPDLYQQLLQNVVKAGRENWNQLKTLKLLTESAESEAVFLAHKDTIKTIPGAAGNMPILMDMPPIVNQKVIATLEQIFEKLFVNMRLNKGSNEPVTTEEKALSDSLIEANRKAKAGVNEAGED